MGTKSASNLNHSNNPIVSHIALKHSQNNANVYVDTTQKEVELQEIKNIHASPLNRMDGIGFVRVVLHESHASFMHKTDWHFASSNLKRIDVIDDYTKNTMTRDIRTGDMLQISKEGHHEGEVQESNVNPHQEMLELDERMPETADKCDAETGGNHDDSELAARLKDTYLKPLQYLCEKYGIPYFSNGVIIEYVLPVMKNGKCYGYESFYVVALHCSGKTSNKKLDSVKKTYEQGMGLVNKFNEAHGTHIVPNMILGGHYHANADCDFAHEVTTYDKNGLAIGTYVQTIMVRNGSDMADKNAGSFLRNFTDRHIPNVTQYDIHFEINNAFDPYATNKRPPVVPIVTEFQVLNDQGELSIKAKEYMEHRRDLSAQEIQELHQQYKESEPKEMLEIIGTKMEGLTK